MADAKTMMLAQGYKPKALDFQRGVACTEKMDGVPGVFHRVAEDRIEIRTRQDETVLSCRHLETLLAAVPLRIFPVGTKVVGEIVWPGHPFKDTSGKVRGHEQFPELIVYLFDLVTCPLYSNPTHEVARTVINNIAEWYDRCPACARDCSPQCPACRIKIAPWLGFAFNEQDVQGMLDRLPAESEGMILRNCYEPYRVAARSYGFQKIVRDQMIDLRCVAVEEAISKDGIPHGRVGRIIVEYRGNRIGVGPGKLSHTEAKLFWTEQHRIVGQIIQIKYKKDPSYGALRQPTFQCVRYDKTEADA